MSKHLSPGAVNAKLFSMSPKPTFNEMPITAFERSFKTNKDCFLWIATYRYGIRNMGQDSNLYCELCQKKTTHVFNKPCYSIQCQSCHKHNHAIEGTIYHKKGIHLIVWFKSMWLYANYRNDPERRGSDGYLIEITPSYLIEKINEKSQLINYRLAIYIHDTLYPNFFG